MARASNCLHALRALPQSSRGSDCALALQHGVSLFPVCGALRSLTDISRAEVRAFSHSANTRICPTLPCDRLNARSQPWTARRLFSQTTPEQCSFPGVGSRRPKCISAQGAGTAPGATLDDKALQEEGKGGRAGGTESHSVDPAILASLVPSFVAFLNESWTQFHATAAAKQMLLGAGFQQLREGEEWELQPGGCYFLTRNSSSILAFAVGHQYKVGEGVRMVAAHTDSPCLKLKPVSGVSKHGFQCVGVQPYGGGLWHTWFDRDLSVAGRVVHYDDQEGGGEERGANGAAQGEGGLAAVEPRRKSRVLRQSLVRVEEPILRIPSLAIHLDRNVNTDGFKPNLETHAVPVLATTLKAQLWGSSPARPAPAGPPGNGAAHAPEDAGPRGGSEGGTGAHSNGGAAGSGAEGAGGSHNGALRLAERSPGSGSGWEEPMVHHHPTLLRVVADRLALKSPEQIVDFELNVCDTQPSCVGGALGEFVFSGRLDNLASCFVALQALLHSCDSLPRDSGIRCVALFDNEEVGSESAFGAASPSLHGTLSRILTSLALATAPAISPVSLQQVVHRSLQRSFLVSADMAHALHPNYAERHEERHSPRLHQGLVVKHNANQRYATNLISSVLFKQLAQRHGIPCQSFVVRNDMGCGSTVGPILAAALGIRTVDVGLPQLAMHSIREMCATDDVVHGFRHLHAFFSPGFQELDRELVVDE